MKSLRFNILVALVVFVVCAVSTVARGQQDLDIHMQLTKTTALLGEPVWADVSVTNRMQQVLFIDFGLACAGQRPLKVQVPAAEPALIEPKLCDGGVGYSCSSGAIPTLQPGETLTRRYVLDGDFRISHPGSYEVLFEKMISYAPVASGDSDLYLAPSRAMYQTAESTAELNVEAADPEKLLALEQADAETAMEKLPDLPLPRSSQDRNPMDNATLKKSMDRAAQLQLLNTIAAGLSKYPAAGMEPVFLSWVEGLRYSTYGLLALKRLNTPAAREALAKVAESQARPSDTWFQSFRPQAVDALVDLGDKTYLPLMGRLLHDSNNSVQLSAASAVGLMGGEAELDLLAERARNGPTAGVRLEAIRAIGDTATLKAVPLLIEFADLPDADEPDVSYYALRTVTHLEFPDPDHRALSEVKRAWLQFWSLHQVNARAFSPYECREIPYAQRLTQ